MRSLVIYESQFGNTAQIAKAIAADLEPLGPVELCDVQHTTPDFQGASVLVVGGPTQGHGVSKALMAALDQLGPDSLEGTRGAAFDTRIKWPKWLSGSAADGIAHKLTNKGAQLVVPPATFIVEGREGPLAEGELERAHEWAHELAAKVPQEAVT
jgi:flavodoxin